MEPETTVRAPRGGCPWRDAERGSVPLALLVAIIVGGLVSVVAAATLAGERSTRFDEGFTVALHVAETGVHEALHLLNTGQLQPGERGDGATQGSPYEWEAEAFVQNDDGDLERVPEDGTEAFANLGVEARDVDLWRITASGTAREVTRTVELDVGVQPLFDLAAFTDQLMDLAGTNVADSYMSMDDDPHTQEWCTGVGRVGTNDVIEFAGGGGQAVCPYEDADGEKVWTNRLNNDGIDIYAWEDDDDEERCNQDPQNEMNNCWWSHDDRRFDTHDEERSLEEDLEWMQMALDDCEPGGDFVVSESAHATERDGGDYYELGPADSTSGEQLSFAEDIYYYCFESVTFDENTKITGSIDDPVIIVTDGTVEFERSTGPRRVVVNCVTDDGDFCDVFGGNFDPTGGYEIGEGAGDDAVYPDAGALQIYTEGSTGTTVHVRQQSAVAAALYAPNGSCGGATSNASVDIFGAMICGEMVNAGGWRFHYDEALSTFVTVPNYYADGWREP